MIIHSAFRRPGKLGRHLARGDTNELVTIRDDLSFGCELEIQAAIEDFAALGSDIITEKSLVHFFISPSVRLSDSQMRRCLDEIRRAYSISSTQPMLVIEHEKPGETGRPSHLHAVCPRRRLESGTLIRDSWYKILNDRLAVQLDAEFGADIVPITHRASVERWMETNAPQTLETIEARGGLQTPTSKLMDRPTAAEKQRAGDLGVDISDFAKRALAAFDAAKGTPAEMDWFTAGFRLAAGDHCVMVVDISSGHIAALNRTLNCAAKRAGDSRRWRDVDIRGLLSSDGATLSAVVAAAKAEREALSSSSQTSAEKTRRGRPPRASATEIEAERDRQRDLTNRRRAHVAADVAQIKADAKAYRQEAQRLRSGISTVDKMPVANLLSVAGFLTVVGGVPLAAAAVVLFEILRRSRRKRLLERRQKALAAADVRRRLENYFIDLRRRRASSPLDAAALERLPDWERMLLNLVRGAAGRYPDAWQVGSTLSTEGRRALDRVRELLTKGDPQDELSAVAAQRLPTQELVKIAEVFDSVGATRLADHLRNSTRPIIPGGKRGPGIG